MANYSPAEGLSDIPAQVSACSQLWRLVYRKTPSCMYLFVGRLHLKTLFHCTIHELARGIVHAACYDAMAFSCH